MSNIVCLFLYRHVGQTITKDGTVVYVVVSVNLSMTVFAYICACMSYLSIVCWLF